MYNIQAYFSRGAGGKQQEKLFQQAPEANQKEHKHTNANHA